MPVASRTVYLPLPRSGAESLSVSVEEFGSAWDVNNSGTDLCGEKNV